MRILADPASIYDAEIAGLRCMAVASGFPAASRAKG